MHEAADRPAAAEHEPHEERFEQADADGGRAVEVGRELDRRQPTPFAVAQATARMPATHASHGPSSHTARWKGSHRVASSNHSVAYRGRNPPNSASQATKSAAGGSARSSSRRLGERP